MSDKMSLSPNRRKVLKMMAIAGTSAAYLSGYPNVSVNAQNKSKGYGQDVDVNNPEVTWEKTLKANELKNLEVIGDIIIPADEKSPSASFLDITDFINEWVSAPYPDQQQDRKTILDGLDRLNKIANSEGQRYFHGLPSKRQEEIFDALAISVDDGSASKEDDWFFERIVYLYVGGYYTTDEGMADIGYVGNVPIDTFDGPPEEIKKLIGV